MGDVNQLIVYEKPIDFVIHGASMTNSLDFVKIPVDTIMTAFQGTRNILDFALEKKVESFVYLSSLEVYGTFDGRKDVDEDDFGALDPCNATFFIF